MTEPIIKGMSTEKSGTMDRPKDAMNKEPDLSAISRVTVRSNELIEMEGLDPDSLDPERHYRLVNTRNPAVMRRRVRQGYEIVPLNEKGGVRPLVEPESHDGTIRFGDRVLMSCPRHLFIERREKLFRFSESRLGAAHAATTLKDKAAGLGTTTLDQTEGRSNSERAESVKERQT